MSDRLRPATPAARDPEAGSTLTIERDYSTAHACSFTTFSSRLTPQLAAMQVTADEVAGTVGRINGALWDAEHLGWATFVDGCLGCLTLFLWHVFRPSPYQRALHRVEAIIASDNEAIYNKKRLHMLNPLSNGLLEIELRVLP